MSRERKGWLFQPKNGRGQVSPFWTIQYYRHDAALGKTVRIREATGVKSRVMAERKLHERLRQVEKQENFTIKPARVEELFKALRKDVEAHNKKKYGLAAVDSRWKLHLEPVFGKMLAPRVTSGHIGDYKAQRQKEGAKNATVNRELQLLRRMYYFGKKECTPALVTDVPHVKLLDERDNVRQGFIGDGDYRRLEALAEEHALKTGEHWLRIFLLLGYTYGWRKGELLALRKKHLSFLDSTIRLEGVMVKNHDARVVVMTDKGRELLKIAVHGKKDNDHVLTWKDGSPVVDFRDTWSNLCVEAGLGQYVCRKCGKPWIIRKKCACGSNLRKYRGLIPHDLRRSAAKALRDAGVPEGIVMSIGGWRGRSMFERYALKDQQNQRDAFARLEQVRQAASARTGQQTGQPPADETLMRSPSSSKQVQ